ncbi:hypothetical protein ABZ901_01310 [Actinacidiphila alni]|uniref:hypothetical protein n=1 Tax=Actinacidiphila alni TaxID=380248 RepID=UPI003407C4F4
MTSYGALSANGTITKTGTDVGTSTGTGTGTEGEFKAVPVWFFAFEGLMGAAYDILKSAPDAWMFLAAALVVNIVLARTVLRGRLKMAKAMLKGRRTRKIALGLIGLRIGVHVVFGAVGVEATTPAAHLALALLMSATTVWLLAFDQRVMLRALNA